MKKDKAAIYLDSCCFIDIVASAEKIITRDNRTDAVWYYREMIKAAKQGEIEIITSYLTVVECTHVKDSKDKKILTEEVKRLFNSIILSGKEGIQAIFPTHRIIELSRSLNWDHGVTCKAFDCIHIATALDKKCVEFITTDENSIDKGGNIQKIKKLGMKIIQPHHTSVLSAKHHQKDLFDE